MGEDKTNTIERDGRLKGHLIFLSCKRLFQRGGKIGKGFRPGRGKVKNTEKGSIAKARGA